MKIFGDKILTRVIEHVSRTLNIPELPGALVHIEMKDSEHSLRTSFDGLGHALAIVETMSPIIITGIAHPYMYAEDPRWHMLMAYKHVYFIDMMRLIPNLMNYKQFEVPAARPADPLALALGRISVSEQRLGTLIHDIRYTRDDDPESARRVRWEELARQVFGNLPFDELTRLVDESKGKLPLSELAGQTFSDVCVDIEGTLIKDGNIDLALLTLVEQYAINRPVTVWSGADRHALSRFEKRLRSEARLVWKFASKNDLQGIRVGVVIDDLPEAEFRSTYKIDFDEYIRVE